jgi:hypothetical protein
MISPSIYRTASGNRIFRFPVRKGKDRLPEKQCDYLGAISGASLSLISLHENICPYPELGAEPKLSGENDGKY